jgi:hypothetical protein
MASSRIQLVVEAWLRENWMPGRFGQAFYSKRLMLTTGGHFNFDAVSQDEAIVASISTSAAKTATGKPGSGKLLKLRSDMLFLLLVSGPKRKFIILTDETMHATCLAEANRKRVPMGVEFLLAEIPSALQEHLVKARAVAAKEVTGEKIESLPDEILFQSDKASSEGVS